MVACGRWLLTGSLTNSNLTDGGTESGFWFGGRLTEVFAYGKFHCSSESDPRTYTRIGRGKSCRIHPMNERQQREIVRGGLSEELKRDEKRKRAEN